MPYLTGLSQAALAAKAAANDERGFLLTGKAKFRDESRQRRGPENAGLKQARAVAIDAAQRAAVDRIGSHLDTFNAALDAEFTLAEKDHAGATALALGANRDLRKAYEADFEAALKIANTHVALTAATSADHTRTTRSVLFVLLGVMVAIGAALAWWMSRAIARPLQATVVVLETAGRGDLTRQAAPSGALEIRRMANATNEMIRATAEAVATIATSADEVGTSAALMTASSQQIASASEGATQQAAQASAAAERMSGRVHAVAGAAAEMGASMGEIASSAASASRIATEAVRAAQAAERTVGRLDDSSVQNRPICWPSTPPSRRRGPVRRARVSPWSPAR